jgi:anti-sigma factor RsiW
MKRCSERVRVQDFLDAELPPEEGAAFHAHLASCAECAAEIASFERLFARLERPLLAVPPEGLTGRILERVLPSRARRRRLAALGWAYAAALAACGGVIALWAGTPGHRALLEMLSGQASRRLLGVGLFVLNALGASAVRLADGWGWLQIAGERLAPLSRALGAVLAQPDVGFAVWAAAAVCVALLWWMRPPAKPAVREVRRVGFVGF